MGYFLQKFDSFLTRSFYKLGSAIAHHTGYFIIIPLLLTALLATGFQRLVYEDDPEYLFAPSNGAAKKERAVIDALFKQNTTNDYSPARETHGLRFARFIVVGKNESNLLIEETWEEIMTVDRMVHEIEVDYDGKKYTYQDICAVWEEKCMENSILDIGELIPEVRNKSHNLSYPLMISPTTFTMYIFPFFFGGIKVSDDSVIESVRALNLYYSFRNDDDILNSVASSFEDSIKDIFMDLKMKHIQVSFFTTKTLEVELEANTNSVIPYFGLTVSIMLVFCIISVTMGDCVRSKAWLGFIGVLCAGLSCAAAFGLLTYIGVPFIGINLAAPFLMLGIGIDDTFVMLAAWRRTRIQDPVPERLAQTFADAAVSITITSITDMISFFIGAITPFPSVQIFCIYTGTAVLMTYLWHITLFGACLAASGYAEKKQLHNVACIAVKPVSELKDEGCLYRSCCSGGVSQDDPWHPEDNRRHAIMTFFRDYVATFLNIPAVKALVVMVFLIYLLVAIWGCTKVEEGLERRKLSRYDSYSISFYDNDDKYFRAFPYRIQMVFSSPYSYNDKETQDKIIDFLERVEAHPHIAESLYTESWLRAYLAFMERNGEYLGLKNNNETTFIHNLREHQLSGAGNPYSTDVVFNEDYTQIVASRFMIQAFNITGALGDRNLMTDLREIAANTDLNVTFYNPLFIFFDQFTLVRSISIQAISLAAIVMMVVSLIFIPNPLCSLWVAFSIVSIEVGVVGYMSLWGVNLDSISMIQLIMCIGFSVDFSAHISYAYLAAKVDTPDERVKECLYALGLPIVQGGMSTILGIMVLILAPSYIFITFFKTVFLVIFFGAIHGILLLPVLLSLLGPGSCSKKKKVDKNNSTVPIYVGPAIRNGGSMTFHGPVHHSADAVPPHLQHFVCRDKQLQIPRPKSIGPLPSAKVITESPRSFKNGPFVTPSAATAALNNEDNGSIERDLGIGTSGEESSESSLRQGVTRKSDGAASGSSSSDNGKRRSNSAEEAYCNNGYISDEYEIEKNKSKERVQRFYGEWENLQSSQPNSPRRKSSSQHHSDRYSLSPERTEGSSNRRAVGRSSSNSGQHRHRTSSSAAKDHHRNRSRDHH